MSGDTLPCLVVATVLLAAIAFGIWNPRRVHRVYVETARRLGLPPPQTARDSRMQWLKGEIKGVEVDIQTYEVNVPGAILRRSAREDRSLRTRIAAYGAPMDLDLRAQGLVDDAVQVVSGPDLLLGDASFDRNVVIAGDPLVARLVLDATTRVLVRELLRHGGTVTQGKVEIDFQGTPWSVDRFAQAAFVVVNLTRRLKAAAQDEAERLRRIVTADPTPTVRHATFEALWTTRKEVVRPLLPALLQDRDPVMRALAARAAGDRGVLGALLAETTEAAALVPALEALREAPDPALEARVLPHLTHPDAAVQVAAAGLLARAGTVAAVEPLLALSAAFSAGRGPRAAAQTALAAVRSRLGSVEAGRLTLAAGEGGALSVAAAGDGQVSIADGSGTPDPGASTDRAPRE